MDTRARGLMNVLDTEKANPATGEIDRMSPLEIAQVINAEDEWVALVVRQVLPKIAREIEEIAARLGSGGRLIYAGAGTSGRLGALNASECPPTFNLAQDVVMDCLAGGPTAFGRAHEDLEDSEEAGRIDLEGVGVTGREVEEQANVARLLIARERRVIGIAVRNLYYLQAFPQLRTFLATYEYTRPALVAAARVIFGGCEARGCLPVSISCID